jgi:hypothetical protein
MHRIIMDNFLQATEYDVRMYTKCQDVCKYRYFYTNLTLFCLFSIYIIYCYETKLIFTGLWKATNYGDFLDLRDVMGGRGGGVVTYPKFSQSTCRNESQKFKPCRDKTCNSR